MAGLPSTENRLRAIRRAAWIMAPLISFPLSVGLGSVKLPGGPFWLYLVIGLVMTPISGVMLARALPASVRDLLVARLGSPEERRRALAQPLTRLSNRLSRATVALELGDVGAVAPLLAELVAIDRLTPLYRVITERKAFLTGDPATQRRAVDALLAWRPKLRIAFAGEVARYHAYVLASALAERPADDADVQAAARYLAADRDLEVRAYGAWLDRGPADADLLLTSAALARAAARMELAQSLELHAARLSKGERAPYRG